MIPETERVPCNWDESETTKSLRFEMSTTDKLPFIVVVDKFVMPKVVEPVTFKFDIVVVARFELPSETKEDVAVKSPATNSVEVAYLDSKFVNIPLSAVIVLLTASDIDLITLEKKFVVVAFVPIALLNLRLSIYPFVPVELANVRAEMLVVARVVIP